MCALVGIISNRTDHPRQQLIVQAMLEKMRDRGPDATGLFSHKGVSLGHNRLSINDLSSNGNQPLFSACGGYCIVFNGEIYNYQILKTLFINMLSFLPKNKVEYLASSN